MLNYIVEILKEQGPHLLIEAILCLALYLSVRSRNTAAKLIDEMHAHRMDDFERVIKLAERAKRLINGHGDTNDKD